MKNKNKVLFASTTAIAVVLSACTATEMNVQEKFSTEISKFAAAETVEGVIYTSNEIDEKLLKEKGFTDEEITQVKEDLKNSHYTIDYKSNKEQVELIIKGEMNDAELGLNLSLEIPVVIDLKNNKAYANFDSLLETFTLEMMKVSEKSLIAEGVNEEEVTKEMENAKKELEVMKQNGFIDLTSAIEDESTMNLLNELNFKQYDLINNKEEDIKKIVDFIENLSEEKFTDKDGSISLDLTDKEFNEFNNAYQLLPEKKYH